MVPEHTLNEITHRLVEKFHPEAVILFGSQARGTADGRSDVDLIVLCRECPDRWDLATRMHGTLWGLKTACDILVFTPEEYAAERTYPGTVARYASKDGRVLYERAA